MDVSIIYWSSCGHCGEYDPQIMHQLYATVVNDEQGLALQGIMKKEKKAQQTSFSEGYKMMSQSIFLHAQQNFCWACKKYHHN